MIPTSENTAHTFFKFSMREWLGYNSLDYSKGSLKIFAVFKFFRSL